MATVPVRFEFSVERGPKLRYTHPLPRRLIMSTGGAAQSDAGYASDFALSLGPIMQAHETEWQAMSSRQCGICGAATFKVLQTPMSWLHIVEDPFVLVWVNAVCGKEGCEMGMRRQIQDLMRVVGEGGGREDGVRETVEVVRCAVCERVEGAMRCAKCRVVAYCGREHQKKDWKVHKRVCAQLSR